MKALPSNKQLGPIQNSDENNIIYNSSGKEITPEEYRTAVNHLLDQKATVLAQSVGMPDAVMYRSKVATTFDKHLVEVCMLTMRDVHSKEAVPPDPYVCGHSKINATRQVEAMRTLLALGTDPLELTIEACRKREVPIVASYRMNAEDWYMHTWKPSDFGRAHPEWRIPGGPGCLDPAIPGVYEHRMRIFEDVVNNYDVDGIEFDWRRWYHMISDPLHNHPILTRMVRETRH